MVRQGILLLYIGIISAALIAGYTLFEGHKLLEGPQISIASPRDGSATSSPTVLVSGEAYNIAFLNIDNAPAYVDTKGHFMKVISPPPGYSVLTVTAKDQFGRTVSKVVHFTVTNYCPLNA